MRRLAAGGAIDRTRPLGFIWEGRKLSGFAGDTIASALLANGIGVIGRSFKYHRPRGVYGAWTEEPNAIVDVALGARHDPNARASLVPLEAGMVVGGVNAWPNVRRDALGLIDLFHRFIPAGFYYKTFKSPSWGAFETRIRAMAGLGVMRPEPDRLLYDTRHVETDVLVVGGGAAGVAAARAAASAGLGVMLADDRAAWGGVLQAEGGVIDGMEAAAWAAAAVGEMRGATLLGRTTVFGAYDHNAFGLLEQRRDAAGGWAEERVWLVRARQVVLAAGAIERPLVFPGNDRPGIMSAAAVLQYVRHYAVLPGREVVIATNNDTAYATAAALVAAGASVTVADARPEAPGRDGLRVRAGCVPVGTGGRHGVKWVDLALRDALSNRERVRCDLLAISGGWSPSVHLHSQAGGTLRWDDAAAAFLPGVAREGWHLAGAVTGPVGLGAALGQGHAAGVAAAAALGRVVHVAPPETPARAVEAPIGAMWFVDVADRRQWIDFQNDVTLGDVALAARENYASVEHLKRYTTLGMANDQGKTSNINGIAALAAMTGRAIGEVGTTTFRPPYVPVSLGALAGMRHGRLFAPIREVPAAADHLANGAVMREYGGWRRPVAYLRIGETVAAAIAREAASVRQGVGLFDGSSLGKIEVAGPDAAAFLNVMFYNEVANLKVGRLRYCLMLRETGVVFDDGVVARLAAERYLLSPSSSHTEGVLAMLRAWQQTEFPAMRVVFHDVTAAWATFAVSGPRAGVLVGRLSSDIDIGDGALPHMAVAEGVIEGLPGRIARVSFTGERGYEISVPARHGAAMWRHLLGLGEDVTLYGIEALSVLRAEKGFILIGTDTDGMTLPADLGITAPLRNKAVDFVGKRSLLTPDALRADRRQFVGVLPEDPGFVPAVGSHAMVDGRSVGWVTTSCHSPALGRSIGLGMIEGGRGRIGETMEIFHLGKTSRAVIGEACHFDRAGERLHG